MYVLLVAFNMVGVELSFRVSLVGPDSALAILAVFFAGMRCPFFHCINGVGNLQVGAAWTEWNLPRLLSRCGLARG